MCQFMQHVPFCISSYSRACKTSKRSSKDGWTAASCSCQGESPCTLSLKWKQTKQGRRWSHFHNKTFNNPFTEDTDELSWLTWSPRQCYLRKCPQTYVGKASLGNSCLMIFSQAASSQMQPTCGLQWKKMSAASLKSNRGKSETQSKADSDGADRRSESLCPLAVGFQITTRDKPR